MSEKFTESLIDPNRIGNLISSETRAKMTQMLKFDPQPTPISREEQPSVQNFSFPPPTPTAHFNLPPAPPLSPPVSSHVASVVPSLVALIGRILQELEANLPKLLSLNPSRRDGIAQHLDRLAGISPTAPHSSSSHSSSSHSSPSHSSSAHSPGALNPISGLKRWIEIPRNATQNTALKTYLEEVAVIALGQAILLKNWSDRGIRKWNEGDLGKLNWALSTTLKPHIPLDRDGWQITRPNLYSWYNPGVQIQKEIWVALDQWRMTDEGPHFLMSLLSPIRRAQPEVQDAIGYDSRFFKSIWDHLHLFGFNPAPETGAIKRNKVVFSPTLRDGTLARTGPTSLSWVGLESSPFLFMMGELMQIWWGPSVPPFWSIGTGLEVHARDQLALALGSPKPSVLSRITEMEACDLAIVLEEHVVRAQTRNPVSARFREQLEALPYFKKLRSAGTSLGDLQACVALSKLRPNGILCWAREEALSSKDGSEVLNFLLDRAKLCCEWDFSELEHSLPVGIPLYPKHFYLFQKESNIEVRHSHRPVRHSIQGQLRSHVEVSLLLEDAFQAVTQLPQPRGHWTVLSHPSPTPQRDWIEKWPDPTSHSMVRKLDQLRSASLPIASFTTIRPTPDGDHTRGGLWSVQLNLKGFWLTADYDAEGRRLLSRALPHPGQETQGSGFLVLVPDEGWIAPLCAYLTSELVKVWLDHHAERRGDRWILNEQIMKWIPIPKSLLESLGVPGATDLNSNHTSAAIPLPNEWERLASEVSYQPSAVRDALLKLEPGEYFQQIHSAIFIRTARALDYLQSGQNRLLSIVTPDGRIRWRELLDILPKSECASIPLHPRIRMSGSLPPHLPIGKIDKVKAPMPGILFATESGFTLHIACDNSLLMNMLWEQLEGLSHPTWNELLQYLRLPRRVELAESTAFDVLRSHGEQVAKLKELNDLLTSCQLF